MTTDAFTQQLDRLTQTLGHYDDCFAAGIDELYQLRQNFAAKLARLDTDGQTLNIGIIGQVKAGKSSFLNALLFDGQPVLPEAATPKTANLTRITYGPAPALVVHYYAPATWASLKAQAAGGGQHTQAKVARELVAMTQQAGVDVEAVLAKGTERVQAADVGELLGRLNDYVGNDGRLTALVEATELQLPLEELKGFEVVDTPGMNDPVASRTQKTREFMARCDVVFFLSRCSQFLDMSDMELLTFQLPNKGVKRLILVACQFDGAILDDGHDRRSLAETEANLIRRLSQRAATELGKLATLRDEQGAPEVAALLRAIQKPLFASSYANGFAHWPPERWSTNMRHTHQELARMAASQWNGYVFTADDWRRIGNFAPLAAAYAAARADKEALLAAQRAGLLPDARRHLRETLAQLAEAVAHRSQRLRDGELNNLAAQEAAAQKRIKAIAGVLAETVNKNREQARARYGTLCAELRDGIADAIRLETRSGTETVRRSQEVSDATWWKPWSWGRTRTEYYTTSQSYQYLAAADAIEQVSRYAHDNAANLLRAFNDIINPAQLRADLRKQLLAELETASENFDPQAFRLMLEGSLRRLCLPELKLDIGDPARAIAEQFSGEVRTDKNMEAMRQALVAALNTVSGQLETAFKHGVDELCGQLDRLRGSLNDELAKDIRAELQQLAKAFANKQQELSRYEELLAIIANAQADLH